MSRSVRSAFKYLFAVSLMAAVLATPLVPSVSAGGWMDLTDLGTLGGNDSYAWGINELGQVVGHSETADGHVHAFLWEEGTGMTDLGTLGGDDSYARGINDLGQVVGASYTAEDVRHAALWTPVPVGGFTTPLDLPKFLRSILSLFLY